MTCMEYEILKNGEGKFTEKKSVFIAAVATARSEEEALSFIGAKKKEHYDARHNCFAYVIGDNDEIIRSSDDGEPSGTAGRPMLDVITGHHLHNVVVVVTRYFGGVLLGTGGLVRAYTKATEAGIEDSVLLERCKGKPLSIGMDYTLLGKIQYILKENEIFVEDTIYDANVTIKAYVETELVDSLNKELINQSGGKVSLEWGDECNYGISEGKLLLF
ncbi:MAG: YigZ family protein [Lachnospiraceae bacterium]|nr:YigZ family protein [Lachnospiraceae bacterium]